MDEELNSLFKRLNEGDIDALESIYNMMSAIQFGALNRLIENEFRAAEILIDIYSDIWGRRKERAGIHTGHWAWIMTITHRKAMNAVNRGEGKLGTNRAISASTDIDLLKSAYLDASSTEQLATATGDNEVVLKSRLNAAFIALRQEMQS